MKARLKNYLSITKKEWNGMVVLIVLIILVGAAPYVYQQLRKDSTINIKDFNKDVALLGKNGFREESSSSGSSSSSAEKLANPVMFAFNPNGLTVEQWKQLGLSQHQAEVIKHYEAKGGKFYVKEDVKKIYAITMDDYNRLEPYINIPETAAFVSKKAKPGEIIELNTADSAKLTELNGIGGGFATQIIRYRGRLGGFISKEQLKEVYGIDSSKYATLQNQIAVNRNLIKKIPINTISFNQLRLFPYFTYKQCNAVIQYRTEHGNYNAIADMKNIAILDEQILRKIEPYLNFK